MNFSNEEIYSMYGQYDKFVCVDFRKDSESYEKYGASLMGNFKYLREERDSLIETLSLKEIPRTEKSILFTPSEFEKLTEAQIEDLDKNGFLCSDIDAVSSRISQNSNRYKTKGTKDIPNTINIEIDSRDWQDSQKITYGFLKARYSKNKQLSPRELDEYFGLRTYYNDNTTDAEYKAAVFESDGVKLKNGIRLYELKAKFFDAQITDDEMLEYITLIYEEHKQKKKIIKTELNRTNQKLSELAAKYGDEIENLEKISLSFNEQILLFGEKLVFLDFERFVHIYTRHVTETHISDKYAGKTVFQYKFDDIMRLISAVLDSASKDIEQHFKDNPEKQYVRLGSRSIYYDGHYYRVEIENTGRILTFHPYNNNEEKENDDKK
jgi:hypothetical protein